MDRLIPIINKLHDVFNTVGIPRHKVDLPQIAVVGEQSVGKSSVLETIVGHDFLPRGSGIVTRRPLQLQLIHTRKGSAMKAELLDKLMESQKKKYQRRHDNWESVRKEIEFVTEKTCPNKNVIDAPIRLKIWSPDVIDVTLTDLPGITKVALPGQDQNIEQIIKKMVMRYIQKKNCLILAVAAANVDIANSEALKISRGVDPKGDRTMCVLTKIDLMDKGTHAMAVLTGKVIRLKNGVVAVKMRGQLDIKNNKPIAQSLKEEEIYFKSHPRYKSIASKLGVRHLTQKLNRILLAHIRKVLPELKNKIESLISHARERLEKYGTPIEEDGGYKAALLQMINEFCSKYVGAINGLNVDINAKDLFGGSRINRLFFEKYVPHLSHLDPVKNLSDYDIKLRIEISKGVRCGLNIPEAAFESLVKIQVGKLELPSVKCCDQVYNELKYIMDYCLKGMSRFPVLKAKVREYTIKLLKSYIAPLKKYIRNIIKCECSFINTNHPDFFGGGTKVMMLMESLKNEQVKEDKTPSVSRSQTMVSDPLSKKKSTSGNDLYSFKPTRQVPQFVPQPKPKKIDREKMEVGVIRNLLSNYFTIVKKTVGDNVPKAIMFFLVNMSCKNLQPELLRVVYTQLKADELLKEADGIKQKRLQTKKLLTVLLRAQQILNEVGDIETA